MISVKELQIGDWVLSTELYGQYRTAQVEDIESSGRVWLKDGCEYTTDTYIDPIPLTDEIFLENGIKYQFGNPWYQGSVKSGFDLLYTTDDMTIIDVKIPIRFVHELQHALRLLKIDKEICIVPTAFIA